MSVQQMFLANYTAIQFIDGVAISNQGSDATQTLTLTQHTTGDLLVAMTGNRSTTSPTLLSGYTNITANSTSNSRAIRVQYRIAPSASETITWTGAYGFLIALRHASRVGQAASRSSTGSGTSLALPDLTGLDTRGVGYVLAGTYLSDLVTGGTSPYVLVTPASATQRFAIAVEKNTTANLTSKSVTLSSSALDVTWAAEFLP